MIYIVIMIYNSKYLSVIVRYDEVTGLYEAVESIYYYKDYLLKECREDNFMVNKPE